MITRSRKRVAASSLTVALSGFASEGPLLLRDNATWTRDGADTEGLSCSRAANENGHANNETRTAVGQFSSNASRLEAEERFPAVEIIHLAGKGMEEDIGVLTQEEGLRAVRPPVVRPLDLRRGRSRNSLSVTDLTASEWCEQRMAFVLTLGKPRPTAAMKAGTERHRSLEAEVVVEEVEVEAVTREDEWALRLLDSVARMQQLQEQGLTRELLVVARIRGLWMVGIIDELRVVGPTCSDPGEAPSPAHVAQGLGTPEANHCPKVEAAPTPSAEVLHPAPGSMSRCDVPPSVVSSSTVGGCAPSVHAPGERCGEAEAADGKPSGPDVGGLSERHVGSQGSGIAGGDLGHDADGCAETSPEKGVSPAGSGTRAVEGLEERHQPLGARGTVEDLAPIRRGVSLALSVTWEGTLSAVVPDRAQPGGKARDAEGRPAPEGPDDMQNNGSGGATQPQAAAVLAIDGALPERVIGRSGGHQGYTAGVQAEVRAFPPPAVTGGSGVSVSSLISGDEETVCGTQVAVCSSSSDGGGGSSESGRNDTEVLLCKGEEVGAPRVLIVDTKTRYRPRPPREAQMRNSRLQLMLYKRLLDEVQAAGLPVLDFCSGFGLHPHAQLSAEVAAYGAALLPGRPIQSMGEVVSAFNFCVRGLPHSYGSLLLRYEWQADGSLLGEDMFEYDSQWVQDNLDHHLQFWQGVRHPEGAPAEERWKCGLCQFEGICPVAAFGEMF